MSAPNAGKAGSAAVVTPSDDPNDNFRTPTDFLYVGETGNLAVVMANGTAVTFEAAAIGYHPLRVLRVATTSTADKIVACWD